MPRKSCSRRLQQPFLCFDMFGYRIGFNIDQEDSNRTVYGAIVSLFIFAWLFVILRYLIITIVIQNLDRPLTTRIFENYFGEENIPLTYEQGFRFAVGLSTVQAFKNDPLQTTSIFVNYAKFKADITEQNNPAKAPISVNMRPCTKDDLKAFYDPKAS